MSRRPREAWGPARRAAFAVAPAAFGALMLLAGSWGSTDGAAQHVRAAGPGGTASALHLAGDAGATAFPAALAGPAPDPASGAAAGTSTGVAPATTVAAAGVTTIAGGTPAQGGAATAGVPAGSGAPAGPSGDRPGTTVPSPLSSAPADLAATTPTTSTSTTSTSTTSTSTTSTTSTSTTSTTTVPPGPSRLPSVEADLLPLTNRDRVANGLGTLSRNSCIDAVASNYAQQLARNGALVHNPASGAGVTGCVPGASWGDNIGTASECDAGVLEDAWMASPSHRHNILTAGFTQVGFGAWTDTKGACWVQVLFSS